jgi:SMC interacting uncharacterized protein involved in chromosome segregation
MSKKLEGRLTGLQGRKRELLRELDYLNRAITTAENELRTWRSQYVTSLDKQHASTTQWSTFREIHERKKLQKELDEH